jgi:hypothetical protein
MCAQEPRPSFETPAGTRRVTQDTQPFLKSSKFLACCSSKSYLNHVYQTNAFRYHFPHLISQRIRQLYFTHLEWIVETPSLRLFQLRRLAVLDGLQDCHSSRTDKIQSYFWWEQLQTAAVSATISVITRCLWTSNQSTCVSWLVNPECKGLHGWSKREAGATMLAHLW